MARDPSIRLKPDPTEAIRLKPGRPAAADVVGVGANSVDYVAVVHGFPRPSTPISKLRISRHAVMCGGQMATALATCTRLGLTARYVGATGTDANGRLVREALARFDIDISSLAIHDGANQFAFVLIDEGTGERLIFWDRDDRLNLEDRELPEGALASCRLVHVDDTDQRAAIAAARIARARGVPVTSDIDRVAARTHELVDSVTVAIFAENVPLELAGYIAAPDHEGNGQAERRRRQAGGRRKGRTSLKSVDRVAAALSDLPRRPDQVFCATLGGRGAVALDDDGVHYERAFRVQVADTTGAGDVFRGGFIYARLESRTLDDQLRFANAAAAVSCTRLGALASVPSLEEVRALLSAGSTL